LQIVISDSITLRVTSKSCFFKDEDPPNFNSGKCEYVSTCNIDLTIPIDIGPIFGTIIVTAAVTGISCCLCTVAFLIYRRKKSKLTDIKSGFDVDQSNNNGNRKPAETFENVLYQGESGGQTSTSANNPLFDQD
jgi:hypothetical protein